MFFMVEVQYRRETRDEAFRYFEQHGVAGYEPGLTVESLWVASADCLAYVVVRAENRDSVDKVSADLESLAQLKIRPVVGMDEI